ncbi:MAG: hypothetical protein KJ072_26105 [Verrucomicrobia bacterium]|nr:hypothetical protein [Verrucomicrobiota bacterium]
MTCATVFIVHDIRISFLRIFLPGRCPTRCNPSALVNSFFTLTAKVCGVPSKGYQIRLSDNRAPIPALELEPT